MVRMGVQSSYTIAITTSKMMFVMIVSRKSIQVVFWIATDKLAHIFSRIWFKAKRIASNWQRGHLTV